jgi:hypothetical protein
MTSPILPRRILNKAISYLKNFRPLALSLFTAIFSLSLVALISVFDTAINPVADMNVSLLEKFFIVCLLSPIIETFIFQKLIIGIVTKYTKNDFLALILSAAAFALVHHYSVLYMVKMFVAGLLFGLLYLACRQRLPLVYVVTSHAVYNLIVMTLALLVPGQTA